MIENTKNNISGATIQCRTSPPLLSKMTGGGGHTGAYISRMGNALGGANGFYLYYVDNIPDDVKNILLIQQLS